MATRKIALGRLNRLVLRRPDGSAVLYLIDDDTGEPLVDISLVFRYSDGREETQQTDETGCVRFELEGGEGCVLERIEDVFEVVAIC